MCVVHGQKKGLDYLIKISVNNPGFFDLDMPSVREGRSVLHYSVFLKNYHFTKILIEFGLSVEKRDASGARLIHLVDQNYEFLLLLRKLLRKRCASSMLPHPNTPSLVSCNARRYVSHP
jgi:hypothetical protein